MSSAAELNAIDLNACVADLLMRAGIDAKLRSVAPCTLGGNNRIFRVETAAGVFAAKQYFRHADDIRDRLAAEFDFLTYAQAAAPGVTPRPYARNAETGMALYEFIEGLPFRAGEIGLAEVDAAIEFFRALNVSSKRATAKLPLASEACFSIADHLALIDGRIKRLLSLVPHSEVDSRALNLFRRLDQLWLELAESIRVEAVRDDLGFDEQQALDCRCISPSDFGFHNALTAQDGSIRFLDFEYAGWDDPAKTAGDFFAQLAVPVPLEYYDHFVAKSMGVFVAAERQTKRAKLLRPVYQIKWCCIALNVFMPVHLARRRFANPKLDEIALKQTQLAKAEQLFQTIQTTTHGLH